MAKRKSITWTSEKRKLGELIPWDKNPRVMTEEESEFLVESIKKFGFVFPLAISPKNHIYDGHQRERVMLAKMDEYTDETIIDVRVSSRMLTRKERGELVARLHSNVGKWDKEKAAEIYDDPKELEEWGAFDLLEEIEWEEDDLPDDPGAQVDKAEELREKWKVESGQIWNLGDHRIIVGDCTDPAVVERLMGGEKARQLITSPPYLHIRDYELDDFDWNELANGFMKVTFDVVAGDPFDALINLGLVHRNGVLRYWEAWFDYCESIGHDLYGWYVWDKGFGFPGDWHGRLAPAHEFIFHFSVGHKSANKIVKTKIESRKHAAQKRKGNPDAFRQKDGSLKPSTGAPETLGQLYKIPDSVIRASVARTGGQIETDHPAVFSVEFAEKLIEPWGKSGDIVYEPFLGSGSALIACERLQRKCRGMEIEPKYVAITLERYFEMTGEMPELTGEMPGIVDGTEKS